MENGRPQVLPATAVRPRRRPRLRSQLALAFAVVAAIPTMGAVLLIVERSAQQRRTGTAIRLQETSAALCRSADEFLTSHLRGVATLAAGIDLELLRDPAALEQRLAAFRSAYPAFVTALAADRGGRMVAADPGTTPAGEAVSRLRLSVADRDYFRVPLATGEPYLSDAFRGRALGDEVIVAVSAAVSSPAGEPLGVVEGSLTHASFEVLGQDFRSREGVHFVVSDRRGSVVYSSIGHPASLSSAAEGGLRAEEFYAERVDGTPVLVRSCRTSRGWTVHTRQPLARLNRDIRHQYRLGALWAAGTLVLATLLALWLARYFTRPMDALLEAVHGFRGEREPGPLATPRGASAEVAQLIGEFERMAHRVARAHGSLQAALEARAALAGALRREVAEREAEIAARTMELRHANQELERMAREDPLTGLANQRELLAGIERAWKSAFREGRPVALLMVDVDCFKQYNDHYGHPAGDVALRAVADGVGGLARRPLDVAGRYGGEEFALLLFDTGPDAAGEQAERLRRAIEELGIPHETSRVAPVVTVSVGVSTWTPREEVGWPTLISDADAALYRAKSAGRNRVARGVEA